MGSSGGGGSSGQVRYPPYIEDVHAHYLGGSTGIEWDIKHAANALWGNSPYSDKTAYDPSAAIAVFETALEYYRNAVISMNGSTYLASLLNNLLNGEYLNDAVDAYGAELSAQLEADVYPRFEAGMRDINAVHSSAFAIGRANIEEARLRAISQMSSQLYVGFYSNQAAALVDVVMKGYSGLAQMSAELMRVKVVMENEYDEQVMKIEEADSLWDINVFQHIANFIAAPQGAAFVPNEKKKGYNTAIGGAVAGAATGFMMGGAAGGVGALPGALIGGLIGLAGGLM